MTTRPLVDFAIFDLTVGKLFRPFINMNEASDNDTFKKLNSLSALISSEDAEFKDVEAKLEVKQREIVRQGELHLEQIQRSMAQKEKLGQLCGTIEEVLLTVTAKTLGLQDLSKNLVVSDNRENEELISTLTAGSRSVVLLEKVSSTQKLEVTEYLEDNASIKNFREHISMLQEAIHDSQAQLDSINYSIKKVKEKAYEASARETTIKYKIEQIESKKRSLIDKIGVLKEEDQAREATRSSASMHEELTKIEKDIDIASDDLKGIQKDVLNKKKELDSLRNAIKTEAAAADGRCETKLALDVSIESLQKDIESTKEEIKISTLSLSTLDTNIAAGKAKIEEQSSRVKYVSATIQTMDHAGSQVISHIEDLKRQINRTKGIYQHENSSNVSSDVTAHDAISPTSTMTDQTDPRRELQRIETEVQAVTMQRDALQKERAHKLVATRNHHEDLKHARITLDSHEASISHLKSNIASLQGLVNKLQSRKLSEISMDNFLNTGQGEQEENGIDVLAEVVGFELHDGLVLDSEDSDETAREESFLVAIANNRNAIAEVREACQHLINEKHSRTDAVDKLQKDLTQCEDEFIMRKVERDVALEMNRNEEHFHDILSKLDDEIKISDRDFREAMRLLEEQQAVTEESFQGEYRSKLKELQAIKMRAIVGNRSESKSQQG